MGDRGERGDESTAGEKWPAGVPRGKLSFVITSLMHGGAETQVCELATRLADRGWSPEVVVLRRPEAFVEDLQSKGIPVHSMTGPGTVPVFGELRALRSHLKSSNPRVIHSHMYRANILSRLARSAPADRPALICTAHNTEEGPTTGLLKGSTELLYRMTDGCCDLTTNVSQAAVDRYVRTHATPSDRIRLVRNGIDTERFRPDPERRRRMRADLDLGDEVCALSVGRLERQKNMALLIRAFAAAKKKCPNGILLIVGAGSQEPMLRNLAEASGIGDSVRFLGLRNDIDDLMRAADVYTSSSLYEGLPIVLLEAAASGLPVVATDVGGTSEIILDGTAGHLVPSENVERFTASLSDLMCASESARQSMGERSREHIERTFGIDNVVDQWEYLYWSALNRSKEQS